MISRKLLITAIAALVGAPTVVSADSQLSFGGAGTTANADLSFRVVIPSFIYFQVGSAGGAVDRVDFDLSAIQPGAGGPALLANGGVGDGADGNLGVTLVTNVANYQIAASGGNLTNGGNTIPLTQILEANTGSIPIPGFGGNTGSQAFGAPGTRTDVWSYTYNNDTVYAPGTYNATVTYTATTL